MQHNTDIPPRSLTADEVRRTRDFIRISKGIRQLAGARLYAILLLSSLPDTKGLPELEITEVEELLRTSDRYTSGPRMEYPGSECGQHGDKSAPISATRRLRQDTIIPFSAPQRHPREGQTVGECREMRQDDRSFRIVLLLDAFGGTCS